MCKTLDLKLIRVWVICFVVVFFFSFNYLLFGFFICFSVKLFILNFFYYYYCLGTEGWDCLCLSHLSSGQTN